MWSFKKCPRCRGDVFIDADTNKSYEKCLQCGYEKELSGPVEKRNNHAQKKKAAPDSMMLKS